MKATSARSQKACETLAETRRSLYRILAGRNADAGEDTDATA